MRKIFISEKFREVSVYKPSKQTFIMEDIQEKYNHLLQQNEALRQENEELESLLHAHGIEYKPKHAEEKDAVYFMFYSCILCRYKGCLSRGCVISL